MNHPQTTAVTVAFLTFKARLKVTGWVAVEPRAAQVKKMDLTPSSVVAVGAVGA